MSTIVPTLAAIITHTPIWVWALFAFVFFMGYQRTKDRTVALWRMLLLPLVMALLAMSSWIGAGLGGLPAIVVGVAVGGVAGWLLERDGATRRLPDGRLWLRGEWFSLLQVGLIVVFRYVTAVAGAMNPALGGDPVWHMAVLFVSSLLSAMLIGRVAARLRVYFSAAPAAA